MSKYYSKEDFRYLIDENLSYETEVAVLYRALPILNEFKDDVKFVLTDMVPDEDLNYWKEKLQRQQKCLEKAMAGCCQLGDKFKSIFLICELDIAVQIVLAKLEHRRLELEKRNKAEIVQSHDTDPKSSSATDTRQEVMKTGSQQNTSNTTDHNTSLDLSSKLPEFHGKNFEEWLKFSSIFTELVHNNAEIPISVKLNYIREKVKNKPRSLIAYLMAGNESNYGLVWETLERRYGNRRVLFTSKLDALLDMEVMRADNFLSVQTVHDTAKECVFLIKKHLDHDIGESADEIFAHIIMRKMDAGARAQYEQYVRKTKSIQKLQDVMEFLEQQSEILENLENLQNCGEDGVESNKSNVLEEME